MSFLGVDLIELDRIESAYQRWGHRFLSRIYTEGEIQFSKGRVPQLAGRFAAKEAAMKALGTGTIGVSWKEIEVVRVRGKAPSILLHGRAAIRAQSMGIARLGISISHSRDYAIAMVIGETNETRDS